MPARNQQVGTLAQGMRQATCGRRVVHQVELILDGLEDQFGGDSAPGPERRVAWMRDAIPDRRALNASSVSPPSW